MAGESVEKQVALFKDGLQDAIAIVTKLAPICDNFKDLVGMCELALSNDAQAKLLMKIVSGQDR